MDKKILVIDDDRMVVKTLQKLLQTQNYSVIIAESGQAALSAMENEVIDLIISDIRMPNMNGVETITAINNLCEKNNRKAPPFKILLKTFSRETDL